MSDYRDENCLEHMIAACQKIGRVIAVSRADFDSSEEKQLALERLFEIVGEASAKISNDFKSAHPWRFPSFFRAVEPLRRRAHF